jgi:hypothetical protein
MQADLNMVYMAAHGNNKPLRQITQAIKALLGKNHLAKQTDDSALSQEAKIYIKILQNNCQ